MPARRPAILRTVLGGLVAVACTMLVALGIAEARISQGCDPNAGTWHQSGSAGEVNRIVVGFDPDQNGVAAEMHGRNHLGEPVDARMICVNTQGDWSGFTSQMFDHDDSVRLDGVGFTQVPASFGPVPASIEATLDGGIGNDRIRGHKGPDEIDARAGADLVRGFRGADDIFAGDGHDEVEAGGGADLVVAGEDGQRDIVDCGPGQDEYNADAKDRVVRCETHVEP